MRLLRFLIMGWTLLPMLAATAIADENAFESIFNGKTLEGWEAVPKETAGDWSVENQTIKGIGTHKRQAFLVYKDHGIKDFELKFSYRLHGKGNTGVDLRTRPDKTGKRIFEAYHADIGHPGIGDHILGVWDFHFATRKEFPFKRGTRFWINPDQSSHTKNIPNALTKNDVRPDEWNHVHVIMIGNTGQFYINGKLSAEFTDNHPDYFAKGAIALQIHDPGVKVEFKNILLRRL